MPSTTFTTRAATLLLIAGAAVAALLIAASIRRAEAKAAISASASAAITLPPTWDEVAVTLHRAGLPPEALAAAGVSPAQTTAVVQDAWTYLMANIEALRLAQQSLADARAQLDALQQLIRSGLASEEQAAQLPLAQAQFDQASADLHGALDAFFDAAADTLSQDQRTLLATIHSNSTWENPIEFNTISMTEPQRVQLRSALANERISAELNELPDPTDQALLAQWRANPTVASALLNTQTNLAPIQAAWNQAVGAAE